MVNKIKELIYMFYHFKEVFCYLLFDISTQFLYHKVMYFSEKLSGRGVIIKSAENLGDFVPFFPQSALYVQYSPSPWCTMYCTYK